MGSVRRRGGTKQIEVTSPFENAFTAVIKRATNREDVARVNMFSKLRQITNAGRPDEIVIERDYEAGTVQVDTILLCLVSWDITDEDGRVYPINEDNLLDLITGAERRWLFDKIMEFNPIWRGEDEEKLDSEE